MSDKNPRRSLREKEESSRQRSSSSDSSEKTPPRRPPPPVVSSTKKDSASFKAKHVADIESLGELRLSGSLPKRLYDFVEPQLEQASAPLGVYLLPGDHSPNRPRLDTRRVVDCYEALSDEERKTAGPSGSKSPEWDFDSPEPPGSPAPEWELPAIPQFSGTPGPQGESSGSSPAYSPEKNITPADLSGPSGDATKEIRTWRKPEGDNTPSLSGSSSDIEYDFPNVGGTTSQILPPQESKGSSKGTLMSPVASEIIHEIESKLALTKVSLPEGIPPMSILQGSRTREDGEPGAATSAAEEPWITITKRGRKKKPPSEKPAEWKDLPSPPKVPSRIRKISPSPDGTLDKDILDLNVSMQVKGRQFADKPKKEKFRTSLSPVPQSAESCISLKLESTTSVDPQSSISERDEKSDEIKTTPSATSSDLKTASNEGPKILEEESENDLKGASNEGPQVSSILEPPPQNESSSSLEEYPVGHTLQSSINKRKFETLVEQSKAGPFGSSKPVEISQCKYYQKAKAAIAKSEEELRQQKAMLEPFLQSPKMRAREEKKAKGQINVTYGPVEKLDEFVKGTKPLGILKKEKTSKKLTKKVGKKSFSYLEAALASMNPFSQSEDEGRMRSSLSDLEDFSSSSEAKGTGFFAHPTAFWREAQSSVSTLSLKKVDKPEEEGNKKDLPTDKPERRSFYEEAIASMELDPFYNLPEEKESKPVEEAPKELPREPESTQIVDDKAAETGSEDKSASLPKKETSQVHLSPIRRTLEMFKNLNPQEKKDVEPTQSLNKPEQEKKSSPEPTEIVETTGTPRKIAQEFFKSLEMVGQETKPPMPKPLVKLPVSPKLQSKPGTPEKKSQMVGPDFQPPMQLKPLAAPPKVKPEPEKKSQMVGPDSKPPTPKLLKVPERQTRDSATQSTPKILSRKIYLARPRESPSTSKPKGVKISEEITHDQQVKSQKRPESAPVTKPKELKAKPIAKSQARPESAPTKKNIVAMSPRSVPSSVKDAKIKAHASTTIPQGAISKPPKTVKVSPAPQRKISLLKPQSIPEKSYQKIISKKTEAKGIQAIAQTKEESTMTGSPEKKGAMVDPFKTALEESRRYFKEAQAELDKLLKKREAEKPPKPKVEKKELKKDQKKKPPKGSPKKKSP